jgi:hypothetical protein
VALNLLPGGLAQGSDGGVRRMVSARQDGAARDAEARAMQ